MPDLDRLKDTKRFWNEHAAWNAHVAIYDDERVRDPETRDEAFDEGGRQHAREIAWFVAPDMRVLELGSGIGRVMKPLAPLCREIVGYDISETMVSKGREYLSGVENASLVVTDGASLNGTADESIDFLYSLFVLIHVDRRSAYRYFREIRRVLRPGRLAYLQFHDIACDAGLAKFETVVESDYPLEFYTEEELRYLLTRNGLDVVGCVHSGEYLYVSVVKGSAAEWLEHTRRGITVELDEARVVSSYKARLRARVRSTLALSRGLAVLIRCEGDEPHYRLDAPFAVEAGGDHLLEIDVDGDHGSVRLDGEALPLQRFDRASGAPSGTESLHLALLPAGLTYCQETALALPHLFAALPIEGR